MIEQIEAFLQDLDYSGNSNRTIDTYRFALLRFERFCQEHQVDYLELSRKQAREFRNYLVMADFMPASVNLCISTLRSFYEFLVFDEQIRTNPVNTKKLLLKEADRMPAFLTPEEKDKVLTWFKTKPYHVDLAFRTMFATGIRISECVGLSPDDVQVDGCTYLIHVRKGKGDRERIVPVVERQTAFDLAAFAKKRRGSENLFGVALFTVEWHARNCRLATGVAFRPHRCRHTFATELLQQGVPIDVIQDALGHVKLETTRVYARTAPEALTRLATHFD